MIIFIDYTYKAWVMVKTDVFSVYYLSAFLCKMKVNPHIDFQWNLSVLWLNSSNSFILLTVLFLHVCNNSTREFHQLQLIRRVDFNTESDIRIKYKEHISLFQALGSDTQSVEYTEGDVYQENNATVHQQYSSAGRHLTSPDGTLKSRKGASPCSFKPPDDPLNRESRNNLKPVGNKEESLLRVESLSEEDAGRLSSGRILASGRLSSPQRESIV